MKIVEMILNVTFQLFNHAFKIYLSPFSSSSGDKISITGSKNVSLFAIFLSSESNKEGNKIKFEVIANRSVIETNPPKAIVPPKLDTVNTKNPKNNTIEV